MRAAFVSSLILPVAFTALWGLSGCDRSPPSSAQAATIQKRLTILTPHNAKIRDAFEVGFTNWYSARVARETGARPEVVIDWVNMGTPRCLEYVQEVFTAARDSGPRRIPDLMFGGGVGDHQLLADQGYTVAVTQSEPSDIPPQIGGLPTRADNGHWFATSLSTFGVAYNKASMDARRVPYPDSWDDLADPRMRGWIGVADPAASGSHSQCMMLILQTQGWEKGWGTLIRILANSRALLESSSEVLGQVRNGVFLASFSVNFDALTLAEEYADRVQYVNPAGATSATPDVVSIIRSSNDPALAAEFVHYCLSEDGQALWGVLSDQRSTYGQTLYHYPLSPAVYQKYAGKMCLPENPLKHDFGHKVDLSRSRREIELLTPLVHAVCGENHVLLQEAWEAIIQAGLPAEAVALLTAPPFDEASALKLADQFKAANAADQAKLVAEWSAGFRAQFEKARAMAQPGQPQ